MPKVTNTTLATAPGGSAQSTVMRSTRWAMIAGPTSRVATALELRGHCRLDAEGSTIYDNDAMLDMFIDAATEYAENRLNASLMPRTLRAVFQAGEVIDLPRGPVIQVLEVCGKGQQPTVQYDVVNYGWTNRIVPRGGLAYPVFVNYRAGYVAPDMTTPAVPVSIKLAILMHAATLYANRESITDKAATPVPHTLDAFYATLSRQVGVA